MDSNLEHLFTARKKLIATPVWQQRDSKNFILKGALDIDNVTIEGLYLIGSAKRSIPERGVMFQIHYFPPHQKCIPLSRIEWNPLGVHTNPDLGPTHLRLRQINGTHQHEFYDNWIKTESRMRAGNLPIAQKLPENPSTFTKLLNEVSKLFNIDGIINIQQPEWQEGTLFGDP